MPTIPPRHDLPATIAFLRAWSSGDVPGVKRALEDGANPNATLDGTPLLYIAAGMGDDVLTKALLRAGAHVNGRRSPDGQTALHSIAIGGGSDRHLRTFEVLLSAGADLDAQAIGSDGTPGPTPIDVAIKTQNMPIADALLTHHAKCPHSVTVAIERTRRVADPRKQDHDSRR